nr:SDS22-delta81-171-myc3 [Cloning vector pAG118]
MDKNSVNKDSEEKDERHKIEVVDDTNPDFITADSELTQDLPDDVEVIDLVHLKIKSLEDLNLYRFKNLKQLCLRQNLIESIEPDSFEGLSNLEEIWLGKNSIPRLINLHPLKNLKILSIQSNKLKKIENLEELTNLEELYLSHNFITKIEGLEKNLKLTTLDVTSNKITSLENLNHLSNLTDIWASFNKIDQSFESLGENLSALSRLETIYLEGNPIQLENKTSYRRKLTMNLPPSLQKIDATYIRGGRSEQKLISEEDLNGEQKLISEEDLNGEQKLISEEDLNSSGRHRGGAPAFVPFSEG